MMIFLVFAFCATLNAQTKYRKWNAKMHIELKHFCTNEHLLLVFGLVKNCLKCFTSSWFVTLPPFFNMKFRISAKDNSLGTAIFTHNTRSYWIVDVSDICERGEQRMERWQIPSLCVYVAAAAAAAAVHTFNSTKLVPCYGIRFVRPVPAARIWIF